MAAESKGWLSASLRTERLEYRLESRNQDMRDPVQGGAFQHCVPVEVKIFQIQMAVRIVSGFTCQVARRQMCKCRYDT